MWDLNFGTWISHKGFTVAFGHGHPLVLLIALVNEQLHEEFLYLLKTKCENLALYIPLL